MNRNDGILNVYNDMYLIYFWVLKMEAKIEIGRPDNRYRPVGFTNTNGGRWGFWMKTYEE